MSSPFNLASIFEAVVDEVPDREALVCGERRLTYAELDERANRLASHLTAKGLGAGDWVGLDLTNGTEYLESMLAAYKIRAVPFNINYRYTASEIAYLLRDANATALIHDEAFAPVADEACAEVGSVRLRLPRGEAYESALAKAAPGRPNVNRSGDDHYVLYTGGTTGQPKGVLWRHEDIFFGALGGGAADGVAATSVAEVAARAKDGLRRRTLPASPFMHGTGHWMAFSTFFAGGSVVVADFAGLQPSALWDLAVAESVTFLVIVGDAFARPLVEELQTGSKRDLSGLSVILSGGAILSPSVKAELSAALPSTLIVDGFGASETGGQGQMAAAPGDVGPPRFRVNGETTVLDDEMRPVAAGSGVVGRLARRGRIPIGYHNDPEKTASTFPEVDGVRWAVPGDLATVDADGTIVVFGRGSVSINTGGEKVHPEEVEAVLKSHPAVFDAVVVGVSDARWGERVAAVVQVREGHAMPTVDVLAAHCGVTLAGYKAPRTLVVVDRVVRQPSGKPDYRWAKAAAEQAETEQATVG
ncbi:MAG: acyl-CoA synthetase [Acidimicrobiales bacterium]